MSDLVTFNTFERNRKRFQKRAVNEIYNEFLAITENLTFEHPDDVERLQPFSEEVLKKIQLRVGSFFANATYKKLTNKKGMFKSDEDFWEMLVSQHIDLRNATILKGINDYTANKIREFFIQAAKQGLSIQDTARWVKKKYKTISYNRAKRIARTEIISASNFGSIAGARATGLAVKKKWIPTQDSRTRDWHELSNIQKPTAELDEPFIVMGEELDYPGDYRGSASNVVNCRCAVGYITGL
jgi:hypothetical protein